ncbi:MULTISPECIES: hypothetical protein [unclassified Thioalkalivibrio]|uniref:hypothetical protein n=1 Tax=unclassified Thioalkalivibrio TaxID=2621013 RepID=UPI0003613F53|nr:MULTISPECIES: hypothetical protein [unclassified Thioalkalivibrio]
MKALLIDAEKQSIEPIEIGGREDLPGLIGYETVEADTIGPEGDTLFFDEECFLRGTAGRFQIDSIIPVSGRGVVVGSSDGGTTLQDVVSDVDSLSARLKYL